MVSGNKWPTIHQWQYALNFDDCFALTTIIPFPSTQAPIDLSSLENTVVAFTLRSSPEHAMLHGACRITEVVQELMAGLHLAGGGQYLIINRAELRLIIT